MLLVSNTEAKSTILQTRGRGTRAAWPRFTWWQDTASLKCPP